ncbi:MAG: alpha/beta hydrolase [Magnetospirillum sp. WYHS-4]
MKGAWLFRIGAAAVVAALFMWWTGQPGRLIEAGLVLLDVRAGRDGASPLREQVPQPRRLVLPGGDLYEPGQGARAGVVLVPGATPAGKDDRAVVAFAQSLARARFRVLVPEIPGLRGLRLGSADSEPIAAALVELSARQEPRQPLGLVAVSYAAGPAMVALAGPGAAERVDFAVLVGGYHDIETLLTYVTTGHFRDRPGEPWQRREPLAPGKWVFLQSYAERLDSPGDRALLSEMAWRRLADRDADIAALEAGLGPEGQAVASLLENRDPEKVPALLAALPSAIKEELARLDPKRLPLGALKARFVLIHGRGDPFIPESESRAFARALFPGQASLYLANGLEHVVPRPAGPGDLVTLLRATDRILQLRDGR